MKTSLISGLLLVLSCSAATAMAQDCSTLKVDLKAGTLNGVAPTASPTQVKEKLPCFTGETEEGVFYNYGGGVFFLDHDFYFYTHRDYLEIREEFKGTFSQPVMGATPKRLLAMIGKPDEMMTDENDRTVYLYKTDYGTLRLTLGTNVKKVIEVGIHAVPPSKVMLGD